MINWVTMCAAYSHNLNYLNFLIRAQFNDLYEYVENTNVFLYIK